MKLICRFARIARKTLPSPRSTLILGSTSEKAQLLSSFAEEGSLKRLEVGEKSLTGLNSRLDLFTKAQKKGLLKLQFPRVNFSERSHAVTTEPLLLERVGSGKYKLQRQFDREEVVLLDRTADQPVHFGTFYNKVQKDVMARFLHSIGFKVKFDVVLTGKALQSLEEVKRWGLMANVSIEGDNREKEVASTAVQVIDRLAKKGLLALKTETRLFDRKGQQVGYRDVQVQNFKTFGQLTKFQICSFGSKSEQFTRLQSASCTAYVLVSIDEPWKIFGTNYLSLHKKQSFVFLFREGEFLLVSSSYYYRNQQLLSNLGFSWKQKVPGQYLQGFKALNPLTGKQVEFYFQEQFQMAFKPGRASGVFACAPGHSLKEQSLSDKSTLVKGFDCPLGRIDQKATQQIIAARLRQLGNAFFTESYVQQVQYFTHVDTKETLYFLPTQQLCLQAGSSRVSVSGATYPDRAVFQKLVPKSRPKQKRQVRKHNQRLQRLNVPSWSPLQQAAQKKMSVSLTSFVTQNQPAVFYYKQTENGSEVISDAELSATTKQLLSSEGLSAWREKNVEDLLPSHLKGKGIKKSQFNLSNSFQEALDLGLSCSLEDKATILIQGLDQGQQAVADLLRLADCAGLVGFRKAKLHSLVGDQEGKIQQRDHKVRGEDMVSGSVKALGVRQYGYGVDVLRYWVCANDLCPELRMPEDEAVKECAGQVKQLRKNFKSLKQILELRREVPPALGLADLRLECQVVLFNLEVLKRKVRQAMLDMRFGSALECIAFFNAHFLPHFCQNALQHVMAFKDERASQIFNTTSILHDHLARLVYPFLPFNIQGVGLASYDFPQPLELDFKSNVVQMSRLSDLVLEAKELSRHQARVVNPSPLNLQDGFKPHRSSVRSHTLLVNPGIAGSLGDLEQAAQLFGVGRIEVTEGARRMVLREERGRCVRCLGPGDGLCSKCEQVIRAASDGVLNEP